MLTPFAPPDLRLSSMSIGSVDDDRIPLLPSWAALYQPNFNALVPPNQEFPIAQLLAHLSNHGRKRAVDSARRYLKVNCELAGLEAHHLFAGSQHVINLSKVRHLSIFVEHIYDRLLLFYQDQSQQMSAETARDEDNSIQSPSPSLIDMVSLSSAINPLLEELCQEHLNDEDPRSIGFVTTQFHFTTKAILKRLKKWDQALLSPYLRFVEEQVCIPWQEVCYEATHYPAHSPQVLLVKQMMALSDRIADTVYQQGLERLPGMRSLRGDMSHPDVAMAIIRDTHMFQGYFWLCFLKGNMSAIQTRLLPLCLITFPAVGVSWECVYQMLLLMVEQVKTSLADSQWETVAPIAEQLLEIFTIEDIYPALDRVGV
jgi:hypothetical protein